MSPILSEMVEIAEDKAGISTVRYPLFDLMRLLLALEVALGHAGVLKVHFPSVAGFLALSGFLVSQSLERRGAGWEFFKRRALRVLPAFAVSLVLALVLLGPSELRNEIFYYLTFGFTSLRPENRALWSLPFEETAYFVLALFFRVGIRSLAYFAAPVGFFLCLYGLVADRSGDQQIYRTLPLLWSFGVGLWAAENEPKVASAKGLGLPLLALGAFISWCLGNQAVAAIMVAPALLILGVSFRPKFPKFPDVSYGIYVYHMTLLTALSSLGWTNLGALVVILCLSLASHYIVEKPALRIGSGATNRNKLVKPPFLRQNRGYPLTPQAQIRSGRRKPRFRPATSAPSLPA